MRDDLKPVDAVVGNPLTLILSPSVRGEAAEARQNPKLTVNDDYPASALESLRMPHWLRLQSTSTSGGELARFLASSRLNDFN